MTIVRKVEDNVMYVYDDTPTPVDYVSRKQCTKGVVIADKHVVAAIEQTHQRGTQTHGTFVKDLDGGEETVSGYIARYIAHKEGKVNTPSRWRNADGSIIYGHSFNEGSKCAEEDQWQAACMELEAIPEAVISELRKLAKELRTGASL